MAECEYIEACRMAYGGEGCKPPCDLDLFCNLYEHKVDRDALLALADELEEIACWEVQSTGDDNRAWMLKGVCDRIREALGVDDR